jgi:sugar fermentation stimulation protein A
MDSGVYLLIVRLEVESRIRIGRLGAFDFPAGCYVYVGSAQRNLSHRLARHARRLKHLRWHIDYLTTRGQVLGAIVEDAPRSRECELAGLLASAAEVTAPRLGSSDCTCPAHLFYLGIRVGGTVFRTISRGPGRPQL